MLPTLTMIDCYCILLRNGPTGGNLEDVATKKTIVAGTDPVALDAYVAKAYCLRRGCRRGWLSCDAYCPVGPWLWPP